MGDGADMCHDIMDQEISNNTGNWEWEEENRRQAESFENKLKEQFKTHGAKIKLPF